jgi:hypothetical protein
MLLTLIGCAERTETRQASTELVSSTELRAFLRTAGVSSDAIYFADDIYSLPHLHWLTNTFLQDYVSYRDQKGLRTYDAESRDCDEFALSAAAYAKELHSLMRQDARQSGFAVGVFSFFSERLVGMHNIVAAVVRVDGELYLVGLEVQQDGTLYLFSPWEVESCDLFYI